MMIPLNKNICMVLPFILFSVFGCKEENLSDSDDIPVGLLKNRELTSNGLVRQYHLFVPNDYNNKPLVVLLHGNRSSYDDIIGENNIASPHKVWLNLADEMEFLLLIPNGSTGSNDQLGWNDCRSDAQGNPTTNDVTFLNDLLDEIKQDYNFDDKRIYVEGISNGGHMAYRLTQELDHRVAAIAMIASAVPENTECQSSNTPISVLIMNGTDDPLLPYNGGEMASNRGVVLSTENSINYWVTRNETSVTPSIDIISNNDNISDGCTAEKYVYQNGKNNTEVVLFKIVDGGHAEPSIEERYSNLFVALVGNQNADFEMAEEVWSFFEDKTKLDN